MSDSKDVSQLIENEELGQETQDELEAFKNLGEADNTRGIVRTDSKMLPSEYIASKMIMGLT